MRILVAAVLVAAVLGSSAPASAGQDPFEASVSRLDRETRALMVGSSWHPGCPVPLRNLRLVRLTYWGFDDAPHRGRLVVHRGWADEIVSVFRRLYERRFPIRRMRLVDRYGADDRASMRHDNTSAFNCRFVAGTTDVVAARVRSRDRPQPRREPLRRRLPRLAEAGTAVPRPLRRAARHDRRGRRGPARLPGDRLGLGRVWVSSKDYQHLRQRPVGAGQPDRMPKDLVSGFQKHSEVDDLEGR